MLPHLSQLLSLLIMVTNFSHSRKAVISQNLSAHSSLFVNARNVTRGVTQCTLFIPFITGIWTQSCIFRFINHWWILVLEPISELP